MPGVSPHAAMSPPLRCHQVVNEGPSAISHGTLELSCPLSYRGHPLLYVTGHSGPPNCSASHPLDSLRLAVCHGDWGHWGHWVALGGLGTLGGTGR